MKLECQNELLCPCRLLQLPPFSFRDSSDARRIERILLSSYGLKIDTIGRLLPAISKDKNDDFGSGFSKDGSDCFNSSLNRTFSSPASKFLNTYSYSLPIDLFSVTTMAKTTVNDTPPSAIKNGGWFSKFIDLFISSIFGKNINSIQEIPQANSAPQIREQREDFVDITLHFHYNGISMSEQELSSRFDDVCGLEHLVHQKCLTEEEIDCLDRLIQSRIVEPGNYLLLDGNQSKEKENGDSNTNSKDNLDCSKPLGLNAAVSPPISPTGFVSTDMIRRPYCRSALCRRISRSSCKDKNSDLIRSLKWTRPSQFGHQGALKRSRSDWNAECSLDGQRRVRQKSYLFRKSFRSFI